MSEKLVLDSFLGIDTSNSEYEIHKTRATDMLNLISESGVNHKRKGYHEKAKLEGEIYGIYKLGTSDTLLVHAGDQLYTLTLKSYAVDSEPEKLTLPAGVVVSKSASWGVYDKDTLYLFCGDYLYYRDGALYKAVDDYDITYIPTTTVSIDPEGAIEKIRLDFEKPNLLTKWRVNSMQGKTNEAENNLANRTYYLDTSVSPSSLITVEITSPNGTVTVYKSTCVVDSINSKQIKNGDINICTVNCLTGEVVFDSYVASYNSDDSIRVIFARSGTTMSARITKANFGALFGLRGNNDRLFVSGASAYPNQDFYSASNDYTYFPEDNYTVLGSSASRITGYSRINDGSLAVHKSTGDTSGIYYRTSSVESYRDDLTASQIEQTVFPITAGAIGEYCMSYRTCKRLGDDPLFLSGSGVCSISLGSNATTNERYAKGRSENIRDLIKNYKESAIAEVLDGKYYLFIKDKCYIADSRYKYSNKHLPDDTFNYEWWVWQMPSEVTAVYKTGQIMYIGTIDGRIWTQDMDYIDTSYLNVLKGGLQSVKPDPNRIVMNTAELSTWSDAEPVLCKKVDIATVNGYAFIGYEKILAVKQLQQKKGADGKFIVDADNNPVMEPFAVKFRDYNNTKNILVQDTETFTVPGYEVVKPVLGDDGTPTFDAGGDPITEIVIKTSKEVTFQRVIKARVVDRPVQARYVTGAISFGTNTSYKTISKIAVTTDAESMSKFTLKVKSLNSEIDLSVQQFGTLDFNNIDFNEFTFGEKVFSNSIVKRVRMRNVNYIQLQLESTSAHDCVLNNLTIEYDRAGRITGGVR